MSEEINGSIRISDDVIATIASSAALEVQGVACMSTGIAGEIYEFIGKKNHGRGVKVDTSEENVKLDVFIIVDYGVKIHQVAGEVQQKAKTAVEEMTGLTASPVNIHVQGVTIKKEEPQPEEEMSDLKE